MTSPVRDFDSGHRFFGSPAVRVMHFRVAGDAFDRFRLFADGSIWTGDGTVAPTLLTAGGGGGVTVHGLLTGLSADDHLQYALTDGSRGHFETFGAVAAHVAVADPHTQYEQKSTLTEDVQDIVGAFISSANSLLTAVYNDGANTEVLTIDTAVLDERIQDVIGAAILPSSGLVNATYNDPAGTITLALDTAILDERTQDVIASALVNGTYVTATYNDAANQITLDANLTNFDARYQGLDSDLTAIAAITTQAYGRALLATANLAALQAILGTSGTPSASTYLRGDGSWATPAGGATTLSVVAKTTTYTALTTDDVILVSAAASWTLALYTAVGNTGKVLRIKRTDASSTANVITVDPNGTETIDGFLTYKMQTQFETLELVSDGTNWQQV